MSTLATRWTYRHGIKGLNGVDGLAVDGLGQGEHPRRYGLLRGVGQGEHPRRYGLLRGLAQDYGDDAYYDDASMVLYADDPYAYASDFPEYDPAGADTVLTVDLPSGTSDTIVGTTPDGMILTSSGWQSLPMPDGSERWVNVHSGDVMLADGSLIPASTPTPDGATVSATLSQWLKTGGDVVSGVSNILGQLGITSTTAAAGAVRPGWVGSQYRTAAGTLVTPTKLPNGTYRLPDGTIVGAPSSGGGMTTLLLVGGLAVGAFAFMRRKK